MGEELEWGKEGWMDTVRRLADPPPDLVLAADCCYIDQVGLAAVHFEGPSQCWRLDWLGRTATVGVTLAASTGAGSSIAVLCVNFEVIS